MERYVYEHLKKYGNTIITETVYEKMGEKKILADLKKHGFDCIIKIYKHSYHDNLNENIIHQYKNIVLEVK